MTDTSSEISKLYDRAYRQGFTHAINLVKAFNGKVPNEKIIEELENYIAEKCPTPEPQPETITS